MTSLRFNQSIQYRVSVTSALVVAMGLIATSTGSASTGGICTAKRSAVSNDAKDVPKSATLGKPAPDFSLKDLSGKTVRLSQLKGKIVVLEWFNPDCPFVNLAHSRTLSLKQKAAAYQKHGIVWLAINSNGPGKQGHGKQANRAGKKRFAMDYPVLLDPSGEVGARYGAKRTPHMFIIDRDGKLVYDGAIDNTRGGDPEDAEPPPAKNYVDDVLAALLKNAPPKPRQTEPWGCSVKYAK